MQRNSFTDYFFFFLYLSHVLARCHNFSQRLPPSSGREHREKPPGSVKENENGQAEYKELLGRSRYLSESSEQTSEAMKRPPHWADEKQTAVAQHATKLPTSN